MLKMASKPRPGAESTCQSCIVAAELQSCRLKTTESLGFAYLRALAGRPVTAGSACKGCLAGGWLLFILATTRANSGALMMNTNLRDDKSYRGGGKRGCLSGCFSSSPLYMCQPIGMESIAAASKRCCQAAMSTSGSDTVLLVAVTLAPTAPKRPSGLAPPLAPLLPQRGPEVLSELTAVNPVMLAASIFAVMVVVNCGAVRRPIDSHTTMSSHWLVALASEEKTCYISCKQSCG